ncbi:unnamed protein product [Acanthoscelides obtectus]|uniref:PRMT5 arginine-N-methyltransferase domain-containing protein n=1 Tax=Acanthoscelides obtectus TaxID=200917 RepID=A0A9P0VUD8_ACAOB|nr:unnamed protein product [Acanthoscelides obtectus]CAK1650811.1 Protein arginine N-methyltransferase 5 [Acanthoscelides obtectus]
MSLDVQYIIKVDSEADISLYVRYLQFLGKKLYVHDVMNEFVHGFEDFLQNPLQPLTEHLETNIYETFEKDQVKYDTYQNAMYKAIAYCSGGESGDEPPVVMVVGAGRGPLVQAVVNVAYTLNKKVKIYAVEKNPFAINTLLDRVKNEWNNQVTLVSEDMRIYEPPEKADILVSELLGSFGDNELSPECLDGAQRYKKLRFRCEQPCVLTGFVGYFDTVLYKDVMLSIHPETHTPDMVSWFPIVFPLQEPVHIGEDGIIEVSFWRVDNEEKVWYEWCLHSPIQTSVMNPNGRSYFIRKH